MALVAACGGSGAQGGNPTGAGSQAPSSQATAQKRKQIKLGDNTRVKSLNPALTNQAMDVLIYRNIFSGLVRYKPGTAEIAPDLAETWDVSTDGKVYTFHLRKDVEFHQGFGPVTADDVKFTLERNLDPNSGSLWRNELSAIEKVEAPDPSTVKLTLKRPFPGVLHRLVGVRQGAILSRKAFEKYGKDFGQHPVGSGPYLFQEWTSDNKVVIVANDKYYGGKPTNIEQVTFVLVPDDDAGLLALERGELDILRVIPREKALIERLKKANVDVKPLNQLAWMMLFMNNTQKPFDDIRVRQAIAHAINREDMVEFVYGGMGEVLNSLVPKGFWGFTDKGLATYEYNPDKAKKLLADAGYPNGFTVVHDTNNNSGYQPLALALRDQLKQVGITVDVQLTDQPTWATKLTSGKSAFSFYLPSRSPDPDIPLTQFFHSGSKPPGLNITRYGALDKEIEAARYETNDARRLELYRQIQVKLMEDLPAIPIAMVAYPVAYSNGIAGIPDMDPIWGLDFTQLKWK